MSDPGRGHRPYHDIRVTFGNRAARVAWGVVQLLLYRPSPRIAHGWRRALLRLFGASIGAQVTPYSGARIWAPWNLTMDEGSAIDDDVICYNVARVHLGAYSRVSQGSFLCSVSHDLERPDQPVIGAPIYIGARAWVAVQAYIGPGVSIGDNAVVGARSTVTRDVASNSVVAGSPARLIRML